MHKRSNQYISLYRPFIYPKNTTRFAKILDKIIREGELIGDHNKPGKDVLPACLLNLGSSSFSDSNDNIMRLVQNMSIVAQ